MCVPDKVSIDVYRKITDGITSSNKLHVLERMDTFPFIKETHEDKNEDKVGNKHRWDVKIKRRRDRQDGNLMFRNPIPGSKT